MQKKVVIIDAARSPIGRHNGGLSSVRPDDLLAQVLKALMERTGVDPVLVEDVFAGCGNQAGEDNRDVARMSLLLAGFPIEVSGITVNRNCMQFRLKERRSNAGISGRLAGAEGDENLSVACLCYKALTTAYLSEISYVFSSGAIDTSQHYNPHTTFTASFIIIMSSFSSSLSRTMLMTFIPNFLNSLSVSVFIQSFTRFLMCWFSMHTTLVSA